MEFDTNGKPRNGVSEVEMLATRIMIIETFPEGILERPKLGMVAPPNYLLEHPVRKGQQRSGRAKMGLS
jgi:hypothetical protein